MRILNIVTGIIRYKKKTLLLLRNKDPYSRWWSFPGGKLEPGEQNIDGLIREIYEETGIQCTSPKYVSTINEIYTIDNALSAHFVLHYYWVELEKFQGIRESEEGRLEWFDQLPDRLVPSDRIIIERSNQFSAFDLTLNLDTSLDTLQLKNLIEISKEQTS